MKPSITFREGHSAEPFQLFVAISGMDRASIKRHLRDIIDEIDSPPRKPGQGFFSRPGSNCEVITPKWNGTNY